MGSTMCPEGSSSARVDSAEFAPSAPGGARRPGDTVLTAQCMRRAVSRKFEGGLSQGMPGAHAKVRQTARTSALTRAPRRSPPTVNRRSRHPRAAPTRTKLVAFDRWFFRGGP